jgi:hypothetical protein
MSRLAPVVGLLLVGISCSSGPSEDEITNDLFEEIGRFRARYIDALAARSQGAVAQESGELSRLVGTNYPRIERELWSGNPPRRHAAAFALGFSQKREAIEPLVQATQDADPGLRARAIAALGMLALPEVPVDPFKRLLADPLWEIRLAALFGLRALVGTVGERGMLDSVHACLGDPQSDVRNEALLVLGVLGREESLPYILNRPIKDIEPQVRASAAFALRGIGKRAVMANPYLIEMLKDEYAKVVRSAWEALNAINEKDLDRSYGTWRDWYEDEQKHIYVCPDHRESVSAMPGECKVCGKKLERMLKDTGPRHAEPPPGLYACPDHPEVVTTTPSFCARPGCGKALVLRKPEPGVFVCPDHPEVVTTTPSFCARPGCGKALVPKK